MTCISVLGAPGPCEIMRYDLYYQLQNDSNIREFVEEPISSIYPICNKRGKFNKLQRDPDMEEWWCVKKKTGDEIPGTRKPYPITC